MIRKAVLGVALVAMAFIAACGAAGGKNDGSSGSSGSGSGSGSSSNLSSIAKTPDYSWHNDYLAGKHASFACGTTCHPVDKPLTLTAGKTASGAQPSLALTTSRKEICSQCHINNYNAAAGTFNHSAYGVGTYCNSCHYSDSFKSHNRADVNAYHTKITTACESCHSGRAPSTHASTGRTSGCANCHSYSGGKWQITGGAHTYTNGCVTCHASRKPASHASRGDNCESCHKYPTWGFQHSSVSSGCGNCHSGHYSGYSCEGCHTRGISWAFSHGSVSSSNCTACHADGGGHGGGGDGGGDGGGHGDSGGDGHRTAGF